MSIERIKDSFESISGYAAKAVGRDKWLRNYWSGGYQTGTNRQSLNSRPEATIFGTRAEAEMVCEWYNRNHKVQVEFEIIKVSKTTKTTITWEELQD